MRWKMGALLLLVGILTLAMVACRPKGQVPGEGLKVYTTFYPLYDFTAKIVGDKGTVINLQPVGVGPHDYEPSPQQMQIAAIHDSKLFVFLGEPMDPWAKKIEGQLQVKRVKTVEVGKGLIENNDPHIWTDPVLAQEMARRIYEGVVQADPANRDYYTENYKRLESRLKELDQKYRSVLSQAKRKEIVTNHAAFGYLARRYGLEQIPITGISPQQEPSPQKMAELIELIKSRGIKYIFMETLASPKLAETLARETGAEVLVLNPIGGLTQKEMDAGEDYFSLMEKNLESLKKALL